jgi:hypothetical protein
MIFKSFFTARKRRDRGEGDAGLIVFLMMALVFVPIIAAHAAVAFHEQLAGVAPQQLAAIVQLILPRF